MVQGRTFLSLDDFDVRDMAQSDPAALFIGWDRLTLTAERAVYFSLPPLTWAEVEECGYGRTLDLLIEKETIDQVVRTLPSSVPADDRSLQEAV